jgi:hypothetical protein
VGLLGPPESCAGGAPGQEEGHDAEAVVAEQIAADQHEREREGEQPCRAAGRVASAQQRDAEDGRADGLSLVTARNCPFSVGLKIVSGMRGSVR